MAKSMKSEKTIITVIIKDVKRNPRQEGTWGFQSFSLIRSGMTVDKFLAKGGRRKDLRWDLAHGNCHLEEKEL
jgi:hypothetical protein